MATTIGLFHLFPAAASFTLTLLYAAPIFGLAPFALTLKFKFICKTDSWIVKVTRKFFLLDEVSDWLGISRSRRK